MGVIATFLLSITGSVAARVLTSLGIGIFSYAALSTLASNAISAAQASYNNLGGLSLIFLNMAGIGQAFGIISGGLIARASLTAIKRMRPI